jgi:hypothetical protein
MILTRKSRVVSASGTDPVRPEVWSTRTCGPLGSSSIRGAGVTVARNRFARRSVAGLLAAAVLAALAGCDARESGNGVYTEQTIPAASFAGVRLEDGIDAVIAVSSTATQTVTLTGDQNILQLIRTSVDPETIASTTVPVLHVWATRSFNPVIPPRVVITRPSLVLARGSGVLDIQITGTAGWTAPGPLYVELDRASLSARDYAVDGVVVDLDDGAAAVLHSNGPVTGTVSATSHLDNSNGTGACAVATSGSGNVVCN